MVEKIRKICYTDFVRACIICDICNGNRFFNTAERCGHINEEKFVAAQKTWFCNKRSIFICADYILFF